MAVKTYYVSSVADLQKALTSATGGETILLASGDYGTLTINQYGSNNTNFASNVTIASADDNSPATLSGLFVYGASNLTFDGLKFDYTYSATASDQPFRISNSNNVTVTNSVFDGDNISGTGTALDGYGAAYGLVVRNSTGITIEDNEFHTFAGGLSVSGSKNVEVSGNEITDIRVDGMQFSNVQGVAIEDNYIHDFRGVSSIWEHRDMIQFWTAGTTTPSTDITISGNTLDIGDGSFTQSIFMGNEVYVATGNTAMLYQNVTIEDNAIYNSHTHGITIGATNGLTIGNNSVLHVADDTAGAISTWQPLIEVATGSKNVMIEDNITAGITGYTGQSGWTLGGNVYVQDTDPSGGGYYADVFVTSSLDGEDGVHHFIVLPEGVAGSVGSTQTQPESAAGLSPEFTVTDSEDNVGVRLFNAGFSTNNGGDMPKGTVYLWDFGDGSSSKGIEAAHAYSTGGHYTVTLTTILPDGSKAVEATQISVVGSEVLSLENDGKFHALSYGEDSIVSTATSASLLKTAATTVDINLGASGTAVTVGSASLDALRGSTEAEFSMTLTADKTGSAGEIFRINNTVVASVNSSGDVYVWFYTTDSKTLLWGKGGHLNDGATHDLSISLKDGALSIAVDGTVLGSTAVTGTITEGALSNLIFGNAWGQTNFDATLSDFSISTHASDYTEAAALNANFALTHTTTDQSTTVTDTTASVPDAGTTDKGTTVTDTTASVPDAGTTDKGTTVTDTTSSVPDAGTTDKGTTVTDTTASVPDASTTDSSANDTSGSSQTSHTAVDLMLSFEGGIFTSYTDSSEKILMSGLLADDNSAGLDLGGNGATATISFREFQDLRGADNFDISMQLEADSANASGEVFRINNVLTATVNKSGDLYVWFDTTEGKTLIWGKGGHLNDQATHDVSLDFNDGVFTITVDDSVLSTTTVAGTVTHSQLNNLIFGNAWGQSNFDATLSEFSLSTDTMLHTDILGLV